MKERKVIDISKFSENELMDVVLELVSDVCEIEQDGILYSKAMPYPMCRGISWYAIRQITGMTYTRITEIIHKKGSALTSQSVCNNTAKAIETISKSAYWKKQWDEIKRCLCIKKTDVFEEPIVITIGVPKDAKDKVQIKIVEKR